MKYLLLLLLLTSCSNEEAQRTCTGKFTYDFVSFFYITGLPVDENNKPLKNNHPNNNAFFCGCVD